MPGYGPLHGLLAVNKPSGISSAEAIRKLQRVFKASPVFFDTLELERKARRSESLGQQQRRKKNRGPVQVKMGHGGTLDPIATGVLIIGISNGTKHLKQFLDCNKSYECVALFGCSTDTYDANGKVLRRAPYKHITKGAVEEALKAFRGDILQKPPIYSALHQDGMRLYEYARKGIPLPTEIKARAVTATSVELVDFTTNHTWEFPKEELTEEDKAAKKALSEQAAKLPDEVGKTDEKKHAREEETDLEAAKPATKKTKADTVGEEITTAAEESTGTPVESVSTAATEEQLRPAAVSIRMTVTSGFYVRSLVHDLGEALGSAAHMIKLVRTRQGDFHLGENVIEWEDLMNPDTTAWEDKVVSTLRAWSDKLYGEQAASQSLNLASSSKGKEQTATKNETPTKEEATINDETPAGEEVVRSTIVDTY